MSNQSVRYARGIIGAFAVATLVAGCGDDGDGGTKIGTSEPTWTIYMNPYPMPMETVPNPITAIAGTADVFSIDNTKTQVVLKVSMLPPSRQFGAHVHKLACADMKAGTHYQHQEFPTTSTPTDPMYANDKNEIWLDFKTDSAGNGSATRTVDWALVKERAKAVVVHDMATGAGGVAGAKLACVNLTLN